MVRPSLCNIDCSSKKLFVELVDYYYVYAYQGYVLRPFSTSAISRKEQKKYQVRIRSIPAVHIQGLLALRFCLHRSTKATYSG